MSNVALSLGDITRNYEQGGRVISVLKHLNLQVRSGEIAALVGPSGSGKSTLLQIAGLLDTPTSGEVMIQKEIMTNASEAKRTQARGKYIGFIYQFHHLLPEFSAIENVMMPQLITGVAPAAARSKAAGLLAEMGLRERLNHRPAALSGGEQQRVAIARALANEPALLLADEPTGNLDAATAESVFEILLRMAHEKKIAMLVATHNVELARRMDRTLRLENGILV
jgi:lipoprotein-releasing system ATP-binding protein